MYNKVIRKIGLLSLICSLLFFSCRKEDAAISPYLSLSQTSIEVSAGSGSADFVISWSATEWELKTDEEGFVKEFTFLRGGSLTHHGETKISFLVDGNLLSKERSQDIIIENTVTREEQVVTVNQDGTVPLNIQIDKDIRFQPIHGFGGMFNPKIWMGQDGLITNEEIDKMFGSSGLGYNILRLMIYPNPSDWQADVGGAKRAQENGALIFASPWDCTDALSEKISVDGKEYKHLKIENYQAYADHLVQYIRFMQENDVSIYAISIQNEPDAEFTYWYPNEIVDFVKEFGDQIRATGVRLMSPESMGFQPSYTDAILNDPDAFEKTDILVGHTYQGFIDTASGNYVKNRYLYINSLYNNHLNGTGKTWWMTEHLFNDGESETDPSKWLFQNWDYCLSHLGLELHMCMDANCSAYIYWYLKRFYGMIGDNDIRSFMEPGEILQNGYIMSHYAKYAAGRNRISVGGLDKYPQLYSTAYEGDDDITLVVLNLSDQDVPPIQYIVNANISSVSAVESTDEANMVDKDVTIVNPTTIEIEFKPMSIVSIRLAK